MAHIGCACQRCKTSIGDSSLRCGDTMIVQVGGTEIDEPLLPPRIS